MKKHILLCIALVHSTINCMQSTTEESKYSPENYNAFIAEEIKKGMLVINQEKWNPLVGAILNQEISKFIKGGVDINMSIDKGNNTLLHFIAAGHHNYLPTEQIMKNPELDLNSQNELGNTPLHYTIFKTTQHTKPSIVESRFSIAKKLIYREDLNPNIKNRLGKTPLLLAIEDKREDLIELFLTHKKTDLSIASQDEKAPLHYPTIYKFVNLFTTISDPNIQDKYGNSPLYYAQTAEAINFLLSLPGINVTIKNILGKTPLDYAHQQSYPERDAVIAILQRVVTLPEPSPEKPKEIIGGKDNNPTTARSFFEKHKKIMVIGSLIGVIAIVFACFHRNTNFIRS